MHAIVAWKNIENAMRWPEPLALSSFQKTIRKRLRRKNYGSFRVPEYEDILLDDQSCTLNYARCIVMGKLPPKMHRKVLAWAIASPDSPELKRYFEVCEGRVRYDRPSWMYAPRKF